MDEQQLKDALLKAHRSGDSRAANLFAGKLKELQTPTQLTPSTARQDPEAVANARAYMMQFQGADPNLSDDELMTQFENRMRSFHGANTVTVIDELWQLKQSDPDKLAVANKAYDTFDRYGGVFGGGYSLGEKADAVGDYLWSSVIAEPTTYLTAGLGRIATGAGSKGVTAVLKQTALKAGEKAIADKLVAAGKGKVATEVLKKGLEESAKAGIIRPALAKEAAQIGRVASQKATEAALGSQAIKQLAKGQAVRSVVASTAIDTGFAIGVDYAYQQGLIEAGNQEEYSMFQSGLTALGALGGGMMDFGLRATNKAVSKTLNKESARLTYALEGIDIRKAVAQEAVKEMDTEKFTSDMDTFFKTFKERVAEGAKFREEEGPWIGMSEADFFRTLILGNDNYGMKGVLSSALESGLKPSASRYPGDNVTSFVSDVISQLPEDKLKSFVDSYNDAIGVVMPQYKKATPENIADVFSRQASEAGQTLATSSMAERVMRAYGYDPKTATVGDALAAMAGEVTPNNPLSQGARKAAKGKEKAANAIGYAQTSLIQMIVSHPGTTALNIKGGVMMGLMTSASDTVKGALYTAVGATGLANRDKKLLKRGVQLLKLQGRRAANLVAPDATYQDAMSYLAMRPDAEKALFKYMSGGVEMNDLAKQFDLDPNQPLVKGTEAYKNFAQKLYLVRAQDEFFKTQNFMYFLDRNIRDKYQMSYRDFLADKQNLPLRLASEEYQELELDAVEETLKSVFAKSYVSRETFHQNPIHAVASIIEDVRKVPIVGAAVPFGQFFNNTIDMMSDYTGIKAVYRLFGFGEGHKGLPDTVFKGAVGLGAIYALVDSEDENRQQGLAWNQSRNSDGSVQDWSYDFPGSFFKAMARAVAYQKNEGSIPPEYLETMAKTFSIEAFTRQIGDTGGDIAGAFGTMFSEKGMVAGVKELADVLVTDVFSAWFSGATRPLDPINQMVGGFREDGPVIYDRKQGYPIMNKSLAYLDQIAAPLIEAAGAVPKESAVRKPIPTVGKLVGDRKVPALNNTDKMLAAVDMPPWKVENYGEDPKLANRLNALMQEELEREATILINSKNWKEAGIAWKRVNIKEAISKAKAAAIDKLTYSPVKGDFKLRLLSDVYKAGSGNDIARALKELGHPGVPLDKLEDSQLMELTNILKAQKKQDLIKPFQ